MTIAELEERSDWLHSVTWRVTDKAQLCADFNIQHLGKTMPLTLTYPTFFPDMPPQIIPRDQVLLSGHQYGPGGELCLEYRPDNWEPSFTGALMMESAFRLLKGEEPSLGEVADVVSAHRTTVGQDIRNANFRFIISHSFKLMSAELPLHQIFHAEIVENFVGRYCIAFLKKVRNNEAILWEAEEDLPKFRSISGYFIRVTDSIFDSMTPTYAFLQKVVGLCSNSNADVRLAHSAEETAFVIECGGTFKLISLVTGEGERQVFDYATIVSPQESSRLPAEYDHLAKATVTIVGCGSVGSKIAKSLARAGVGSFVLIDGDVLFPGNLVRNDLDWRSVGLNKPDAVASSVMDVKPSARLVTKRIDLGGQESSVATDAVLVKMAECDVIVDATADPQVFNICGSIARSNRRPLVFGEVFGGGIGGFVGRLRPDIDPAPHAARRQIVQWCTERGRAPPKGSDLPYGSITSESMAPLIADDADVTLISGHMTRLVVDLLVRSESIFPQSAYAVGLKPGWIFKAPFDTWPIALEKEGEWGPPKDEKLSEHLEAFVAEFFPNSASGSAA